jgi:cyclic pyranopterin phosphate synthase
MHAGVDQIRMMSELIMDTKLSHLEDSGHARMVNVGNKPVTERRAVAKGEVHMHSTTLELIRQGVLKKGDLIAVAKVAGVMAAKRTAELIPMCHPLPLTQIEVALEFADEIPGIEITACVRTNAQTGVEMEALTAVSVAALTIYDMAKSAQKTMRIANIHLVEKQGGQSGEVFNK